MALSHAYLDSAGAAGTPRVGVDVPVQQQDVYLRSREASKLVSEQRRLSAALTALMALGAALAVAFVVVKCFKALKYNQKRILEDGARILAEGEPDQCSVGSSEREGYQCS